MISRWLLGYSWQLVLKTAGLWFQTLGARLIEYLLVHPYWSGRLCALMLNACVWLVHAASRQVTGVMSHYVHDMWRSHLRLLSLHLRIYIRWYPKWWLSSSSPSDWKSREQIAQRNPTTIFHIFSSKFRSASIWMHLIHKCAIMSQVSSVIQGTHSQSLQGHCH